VDGHQQELTKGEKESSNKRVSMSPYLSVLHQNIQSISNKKIVIDLQTKIDRVVAELKLDLTGTSS
jgi:hypothetical protein